MSQERPELLIISFSHLHRDARVRRQIEALRSDHIVHVAGFSSSNMENGRFIALEQDAVPLHWPTPLRKALALYVRIRRWFMRDLLNWYGAAYWERDRRLALRALHKVDPDLIIANDIEALPLGVALAQKKCPLIYDAHEYSPRQQDGDPAWLKRHGASNTKLCRIHMPKADACFTVSESIAEAYLQLVGVRPQVLTNAPAFEDIHPTPPGNGPIRLVHHGVPSRHRDTPGLITMMDGLVGTHELHLYLTPVRNPSFTTEIEELCRTRTNVHLHPGIPPESIARTISQYDVGVHHLPPTSFNHIHALPNKLFEFVQARLAIAIGPNRDMADLVSKYHLGAVAKGHGINDLQDAIRSLTREDIQRAKRNAHQHALALSSRTGMALLRETVARLLSQHFTDTRTHERNDTTAG